MSPDDLRQLFSGFGPVTVRRMFGGAGIFRDGLMFGLVSRGTVYLKADAQTFADFAREGCGPFAYATKHGERTIASFRRLPDRLYDDAEELSGWAAAAFAAAQRAGVRGVTRPSRPRRRSSRDRSRR